MEATFDVVPLHSLSTYFLRHRRESTTRCRGGGRSSHLVKNCFVALGFKCFLEFKDFWMRTVYPQKKVARNKTKPGLICAVVRQMSWVESWKKTKTERENSCSQPPCSSGINVLYDYLTIYYQRHQKLWKRKNRDQFGPTCLPGKYSQASTSVAPSIRWRVKWHQTG
jgi:hypothetical protein